ncbi:MAG: hypothetical protein ABJL99_03375 [Aliishimia sp.]
MMAASTHSGPGEMAQNPDLGQRLVLDPNVTRVQIDAALTRLGFVQDDDASELAASWRMFGTRPFVVWTFNPVFRLSVLDVGTVPPAQRAQIIAALPILGLVELERRLKSNLPGDVLLALWALVDREEVGHLPMLRKMAQKAAQPLADEITLAMGALGKIDAQRRELIGGLRLVAQTAGEVIDALADPNVARSLLVTPDECASLFTPDIAADVAELLQTKPHNLGRGMEGRVVNGDHIVAAQAGLLRWHNMFSRAFPMGYRDAAGWMSAQTVWVAWKTETAPEHTMTYDGLVLCDGQWRLFPRAYRAVAQVMTARQTRH